MVAPDWVLVTPEATQNPAPVAAIGRYAFAVYDEGGLLDMSVAGYPGWTGNPGAGCSPAPTPWLVNVGRKGNVGFADLTALGTYAPPQTQIDNIVGWRNYAMTQRPGATFGGFNYSGEIDCAKQDWYGSYLLYFGDPPFLIDSLSDKLLASLYPFTCRELRLPNPGTRCQLPDGSGTYEPAAICTTSNLSQFQSERASVTWELSPANEIDRHRIGRICKTA